jgi:hypothetical protein
VISKYGVTVDEENPWKALLGIPIDPVHLRPLVETIGFLYNKCHLHEASQIRSKSKRQFECGTCQLFAIVFRRNKNDGTKAPYTMKVEPPSHHQTCPATNIVPSHHVLENMTEFTDFVYSRLCSGKEVLGRDVREHLASLAFSLPTTTIPRTSLTRSIEMIRKWVRSVLAESYLWFPNYLRRYVEGNPSAVASLQVDDHGCFYRTFISIPHAYETFVKLCIPILFIDGCFSRCPSYDGTIILINAKTGNGGAIPLAIAWVPSESVEHLSWVLLMIQRCKFDLQSFPIFTDRGKLLSASAALKQSLGIVVSLKYCLEHLIRNVVHKFSLKKSKHQPLLRARMSSVQEADTLSKFIHGMEKLAKDFEAISVAGHEISFYLLSINPRHWTVFGNRPQPTIEDWTPMYLSYVKQVDTIVHPDKDIDRLLLDHLSTLIPPGEAFPLFNNIASELPVLLIPAKTESLTVVSTLQASNASE